MTGNAPATIALSARPPAWNLLPIQPGEAAATPIQPNEHTYCIVNLTFLPLRTEVCRGMQCAPHGGSFHSLVRHPPPERLQSAPLGNVYPEIMGSMLVVPRSVDAAKTDRPSPRSTLNASSLRYRRQFFYVLRLKIT